MTDELKFKPFIGEEKIKARLKELGEQITLDYEGEEIVVVGVLKGAIVFLSDLIRNIDLPVSVEFIGVASYEGTKSTGHVRLTHDLTAEIQGKNVLLVEDIIDSGRTVDYLLDVLKVREPKSLKVASFLSKPDAHDMNHKIHYLGFEISNEFVIGYGLDLDQKYRNLPYLAQVKT